MRRAAPDAKDKADYCNRTATREYEILEAHHISPDRPLENPADDRLGYRPFAAYLAEALRRMVSTQGFVVALYGAWGSGKSTLLNFVEREISQGQPKATQPIIIRFNPWWFSGHEDLAARFFDQLLLTLDEKGYGERELRSQIADLSPRKSTHTPGGRPARGGLCAPPQGRKQGSSGTNTLVPRSAPSRGPGSTPRRRSRTSRREWRASSGSRPRRRASA